MLSGLGHRSAASSINSVNSRSLHDKISYCPGGKVCLVTGASFAETSEQALAELKPLGDCPVLAKSLGYSPPAPVTFEELFDASGALWPTELRSRVEAAFTNAPAGKYAQISAD